MTAINRDQAVQSDANSGHCPLMEFVNLVSGKWAIPILYKLIAAGGPVRFGALQRAAHPITQKELTRYLRYFEEQGLVRREVFSEMPPRVEYQITNIGATLKEPLDGLVNWMVTHGEVIIGPTQWRTAPKSGEEADGRASVQTTGQKQVPA